MFCPLSNKECSEHCVFFDRKTVPGSRKSKTICLLAESLRKYILKND